ncbi:abc transporter permease, partial [Lasius niger]
SSLSPLCRVAWLFERRSRFRSFDKAKKRSRCREDEVRTGALPGRASSPFLRPVASVQRMGPTRRVRSYGRPCYWP